MRCAGFQNCAEAEGYQFDLASGVLVAVAAVMFLLEVAQEILREGEIEFVSLAAVAEVDTAAVIAEVRAMLRGGNLSRLRFLQRGKFVSKSLACGISPADAPQNRSGIIFHDVACENAESGERAGQRGDDDVRDAESVGQGAGVEASRAAKGYEGEVARVAAALDGDDADGFLHGRVDDANDAGSETVERESELPCCLSHSRVMRRVRSRSRVKSPPRKRVGWRRPRSRLASVTVGCGPRP